MFPTDDSVYKLVYLAIKNATKDWSKSVFRWRQAMLQFVVPVFSNDLVVNLI